MKILKMLLITFIVLISNLQGQTKIDINAIEKAFESFNYKKVIELSDTLLSSDLETIKEDELINIYLMKGISHYSVNQNELSRVSFINILKQNKNYTPDSKKVSPKIIAYFNSIKSDFETIVSETIKETEPEINQEKIALIDPAYLTLQKEIYTTSITRSLILPGLGHLYINDNSKGWILTGLSSALLASSVYYIIEANSKENDYLALSGANKALIKDKYDDYNSAYKIRNALITSYIAVWVYSQIDILLFSDEKISSKIETDFNMGLNQFGKKEFTLSFKLNF